MTEAAETGVVALVPDLMDRSRMLASGQIRSSSVRFLSRERDLSRAVVDGELVVVDLSQVDDVEELAGIARRVAVVAFGAHVDRARLDAARAAGCRKVMPRSLFFSDVAAALQLD